MVLFTFSRPGRALACWLWLACASLAARAQSLPAEVEALLTRAGVPSAAMSAVVVDAAPASGKRPSALLQFQPHLAMNPASVMKLVTTYAGLELLGPAYTWTTPVYADGSIAGGVLTGNLVIQGRGDPALVVERLWLLLRRVQGLGIRTITGDIVLDRSAFDAPTPAPGDFDGEPLRPYNVQPSALLVNYASVAMAFTPQPGAGLATIGYEPPLAGVQMQASVPLAVGSPPGAGLADCGDWRAQLAPALADPARLAFAGSYPPGCGQQTWSVAYAEPATFAERAIAGLWQDLGGTLGGRVRAGSVPPGVAPAFALESPPLAEVIRTINKFSNNVMAQQLFLSLSLQRPGGASFGASRAAVAAWWQARIGNGPGSAQDAPILDNGSGLSRAGRVTALGLARMLQTAYASAVMPELMASLPIVGVDGTLRRSQSALATGRAHLKSGTLRDATALAGYVLTPGGRRLVVVVGIVNHPNAPAARPALEALVDWAASQAKDGNR